jgi:hypothetical protein
MMTVTDDSTEQNSDNATDDSGTDSSSEELSDSQLHEQLVFQARRAAATNTTIPTLTREAIELRRTGFQPLHPKRVSVTTHTYARQYAQDIMETQSRAILDDSAEMQAAYYDSDISNASMDLSSLSISPGQPQGQTRNQTATPRITDFFTVRPTSLESSLGQNPRQTTDVFPVSMTQQSLRDASQGYAFVAALPASITRYYPEDFMPLDCSMSPVGSAHDSSEDSEDDTPISELFIKQETSDFQQDLTRS